MNTDLREKCDLLVENRNIIRDAIKWESDLMTLAGASFFVGMGMKADSEKLKNCNEILKDKAGLLSDYRGNVKIPLLCKMSASEDPDKYFEDINTLVSYMKDLKWIDKQYKIMAAITIKDHGQEDEYMDAVDKMVKLYKGMKENHPWLTSSEDIPFASMLAASEIDEAEKNPDEYRIEEVAYGQTLAWLNNAEKDAHMTYIFDHKNNLVGAAAMSDEAGIYMDILTFIINEKMGVKELSKYIFAFPTTTYGLISSLMPLFLKKD